jgi:hypothetical protein
LNAAGSPGTEEATERSCTLMLSLTGCDASCFDASAPCSLATCTRCQSSAPLFANQCPQIQSRVVQATRHKAGARYGCAGVSKTAKCSSIVGLYRHLIAYLTIEDYWSILLTSHCVAACSCEWPPLASAHAQRPLERVAATQILTSSCTSLQDCIIKQACTTSSPLADALD